MTPRPETVVLLTALKKYKDEGLCQWQAAQKLGKSRGAISQLCHTYGITGWPYGAAARDQTGIYNPNYFNGASRGTVNRKTKTVLLEAEKDLFVCERCGATSKIELPRHHKDRNRKNNIASNLEVLCVSCHNKEHMPERIRSSKGVFIA